MFCFMHQLVALSVSSSTFKIAHVPVGVHQTDLEAPPPFKFKWCSGERRLELGTKGGGSEILDQFSVYGKQVALFLVLEREQVQCSK